MSSREQPKANRAENILDFPQGRGYIRNNNLPRANFLLEMLPSQSQQIEAPDRE
jgi:hypothetical protein